jgi:hypothetical protein
LEEFTVIIFVLNFSGSSFVGKNCNKLDLPTSIQGYAVYQNIPLGWLPAKSKA